MGVLSVGSRRHCVRLIRNIWRESDARAIFGSIAGRFGNPTGSQCATEADPQANSAARWAALPVSRAIFASDNLSDSYSRFCDTKRVYGSYGCRIGKASAVSLFQSVTAHLPQSSKPRAKL
jgi:hypothetical protein